MNLNRLLRQNIEFRIESLQEYNSFVEANIESELSDIQQKYEIAKIEYDKFIVNQPINQDDDFLIDYFDDLSYSHTKIQDNIILKHRNSIIFLLYSLVEDELYGYAKHNSYQTSVFSIDDLKGNSTFEKFKMYITKTDPVLFNSIKKELEFLDDLRIVRNLITHHSSTIRTNHTHFNKVQKFSEDNFEFEQLGFIYKTNIKTYIIKLNNKQFINSIFTTLNSLFDKMYLG